MVEIVDHNAQELSAAENELHGSLKQQCAAVLKGKRPLLFGEMLREISYPDVHLIDDICEGFKITGWMRDSGCFEKIPKQPTMTVQNLIAMSNGLNQAAVSRAAGVEDDDLVKAAWEATQLELEKEWIWLDKTGDFSGPSLTHRFGLQQKKKVCVIDNFKTSGVNATCGAPEKQKLFGVDFWLPRWSGHCLCSSLVARRVFVVRRSIYHRLPSSFRYISLTESSSA